MQSWTLEFKNGEKVPECFQSRTTNPVKGLDIPGGIAKDLSLSSLKTRRLRDDLTAQ